MDRRRAPAHPADGHRAGEIGSAAAADIGGFHLGRALLALIVALALQVGVNYANDYSDGIRGTDDVRVGPLRLTGSGAAPAAKVKTAAFACSGWPASPAWCSSHGRAPGG